MKILSFALAAVCMAGLAGFAQAQERAAAGAVDTQMTWSALSGQIKTTNDNVTALDTKLTQAVLCGKANKLYAPGAAGADGSGCKEVDLSTNTSFVNLVNSTNTKITNLQNTVTSNNSSITQAKVCAQSGWVYSPGTAGADSNGCIPTSTGKGCVMDQAAACGKVGYCVVRARYPFGKSESNTSVPVNWKDGDTYIWKYASTQNDYGGAQCVNGVLKYFATGN